MKEKPAALIFVLLFFACQGSRVEEKKKKLASLSMRRPGSRSWNRVFSEPRTFL